jgi:hypothetical protein
MYVYEKVIQIMHQKEKKQVINLDFKNKTTK